MTDKSQEEIEKKMLGGDYDLPEVIETDVEVPVDPNQKRVSFHDLEPLKKIAIAARSQGVSIKEPDPNCNGCHGTGYISTQTFKTSGSDGEETYELPQPCKCVFHKQDLPKMFKGSISLGSKARRKYEKRERISKRKKEMKNSLQEQTQKLKSIKKSKQKKKKKLTKKQKRK